MIPNPPNYICEHDNVYYSPEHDNFYCGKCHAGMGNAYYKLAIAARKYTQFVPAEGCAARHKAYKELVDIL